MLRKSTLVATAGCLGLVVTLTGMAAAVSDDQIAGVRGTSSPTSHLKTRLTGLVLSSAAAQTANYRLFTASGSFTVPAGVARMIVEVRGAGGGGGAGVNGGTGAGGGQGGWERVLVKAQAGSVYVVTVGKGGAGGTAGATGGTGGSTTVHLSGKSALTARATGGGGAFPGESCDAAVHNGPVPGGSGGDGLAPTDPASLGLDTAAPRSGISSSYLPPTCPSTPIGGTGGGRGFAGAGGDGGAGPSSGNGASGHGGLVLVTFLR
ncbi:MAG TPA: hypothetical protein VF940_19520 [Streptosporangiaceae bacterium]